jgi:transposase
VRDQRCWLWCSWWVPVFDELSREELVVLAAGQAEEIAALRAENTDLAGRLARVERLLSRNSGNSSMPPSKDGEPGKTPPALAGKKRGGRKRGKQPGAAGANLAWREIPDGDRRDVFPKGTCDCGAGLTGADDLGVRSSYQQTEIPLVSATTIQYDRHEVRCRCGRKHTAPPPEGATTGNIGYGPNLLSWCVFLMVVHAVPVQRCAGMLESLTGAAPSVGFVHGTLKRAAAAMAPAARRIRSLITSAHAVSCDETPIKVGPKKPRDGRKKAEKYLLVACTSLYTWYLLGDRDLDTFKEFGLDELAGVVVHDRYSLYDHPEVGTLVHQLCCQHIQRDLEDAAQTYLGAHWPLQIQNAVRELIHQANIARDDGLDAIPAPVADPLISAFRHGVRVGLSEVRRTPGPKTTTKQPVGRLLLEVLRDRENDVLRFTGDLLVPPTSNQAERDVRPAKTQQKISGRLTSEARTRDRYLIYGVISTAAKHGLDQLNIIRGAITGKLWLPPFPAPT